MLMFLPNPPLSHHLYFSHLGPSTSALLQQRNTCFTSLGISIELSRVFRNRLEYDLKSNHLPKIGFKITSNHHFPK
jgi:hypothetical protein